jgi:hypothetical protein
LGGGGQAQKKKKEKTKPKMYDYTMMACKLHDRAVSRNYRLILLFLFGVNHICFSFECVPNVLKPKVVALDKLL